MTYFYDVEYTYCGVSFKTTMLADGKDQIQKILGTKVVINSYRISQ